MINPNIKNISEPPIPLALSWSNSYNGKYGDVIDMSQAVPSYPPHIELQENFKNFSSDISLLSYGEIEGEHILRENYSDHINKKYSARTSYNDVLVTSGCNQAFIASVICLAETGDEIMISNPGYFSHELSLKMLNIKPKYFELNSKNEFEINLDDIEKRMTSKVKAIVVVSPGNPTGSVHDKNKLDKLLDLCVKKNKYLIIDETYRDFIFPNSGQPHNLLNNDRWRKNLIQLYSFSKSFCIPGHRLGAITADSKLISQISKVMDNIQICAPRPAQHAVASFLPKIDKFLTKKCSEIGEKAKLFSQSLQNFDGWKISSMGTFFAYVKHPYNNIKSDKIAKILATKCGVVTIPGIYFGNNQEKFLRMSIAGLSYPQIKGVMDRLKILETYI